MARSPSRVAFPPRHPVRWAVVAGLLGALGGCGPGGPKTHPVRGKVVTGKPEDLTALVGQAVEFQSASEPETRGFGQIQADGSFSISTYRQGVSLSGAVEGTHKVRLMIDPGRDDADGRPRKGKWSFDRKYTQFETSGWTVTVPADGEVVLRLP